MKTKERNNLNPANQKRGNTPPHIHHYQNNNKQNNHFSFIYLDIIDLNFLIKWTKINSMHTGNTLQRQRQTLSQGKGFEKDIYNKLT